MNTAESLCGDAESSNSRAFPWSQVRAASCNHEVPHAIGHIIKTYSSSDVDAKMRHIGVSTRNPSVNR